VLAIHGITANARTFDGLARALGTGHRIIAMDLRGRGESDAPPGGYDVETHASDALAVIGAAGVDRCSVVGWSLGGRIALAMAALHPARVSRVIALDPPLVTREASRAVLRGFWTRLTATYPSVDAYVERMADAALFGGRNAIVEAYLRADVRRDANGLVRHRVNPRVPELELAAEDRLPTAAYLAAVRCPVLIVRSAGTAPIRVPEGWMLIFHGVAGEYVHETVLQPKVRYAAGILILDAADVSRVIARSAEPLLEPELVEEVDGIVPNVVFPTAIEPVSDAEAFVFYGDGGLANRRRSSAADQLMAAPRS